MLGWHIKTVKNVKFFKSPFQFIDYNRPAIRRSAHIRVMDFAITDEVSASATCFAQTAARPHCYEFVVKALEHKDQ
jgi:hypothetical protein